MANDSTAVSVPPEPPPPRRKRSKSKADLAVAILKHREQGKAHYETADELLTELLGKVQVGDFISLPDGRKIEVVDNFAKSNKVFRAHGISRFELKVHEAKPQLPH